MPPAENGGGGGGFLGALKAVGGFFAGAFEALAKWILSWVVRLIVTLVAFAFNCFVCFYMIKLGARTVVGMFTMKVER